MNDPRGDQRKPRDIGGKRMYSLAYIRDRGRWRRTYHDPEMLKFTYDETYISMAAARPSRLLELIRRRA